MDKRKGGTDKPIRPAGRIHSCDVFFLTSNLQLLKLRCAYCSPLLEAFPAKHRPPLRGPEGNGGFLPALRAIGLRFRAGLHGVPAASATLCPFCLASFTSLWFVLESLVGKKHLLAGSEHELRTTFGTLQHLVMVFHEALSPGPVLGRRMGELCT